MSTDISRKKEKQLLDRAYWYRRLRLRNKDFTIISNDCSAAFIYTDLRMKKLTPTINMVIANYDFVCFCRHLREYLSMPVDEATEEEMKRFPGCKVPVGILHGKDALPDIGLIFTHYRSIDEAREKWYERRERVNYDNLFFILDCGMEKDEKLLDAFESLPCKNKVAFTQLDDTGRWKDTFRPGCFDAGYGLWNRFPGIISEYIELRWIDEFDYVSWLNGRAKQIIKRNRIIQKRLYIKERKKDNYYLTLINRINPMDFSLLEKIVLKEYCDSPGRECRVEEKTLENYRKLKDYISKYGVNIGIFSGYRSFDDQVGVYNFNLKVFGNDEEITSHHAARPGESEHHTGLALDITIYDDEKRDDIMYMHRAYSILHTACPYFGFIVRYPDDKRYVTGYVYEPWHIRYVGRKAAMYISKHKFALEEYFF